jgi:hypothetical protein
MDAVAGETPLLSGLPQQRTAAALAALRTPEPIDLTAARAAFAGLVGDIWGRSAEVSVS